MHTPSKDALRCHTENGGRGLDEAGPCRANTSEKQQRAENPTCDGCERLEVWPRTGMKRLPYPDDPELEEIATFPHWYLEKILREGGKL